MFTVVPATLAALATVSIGASEKLGNEWLPILAMFATGVASILGAWESLFSNRKLWRVNNIALTHLYELKSDIEYREKAVDRPIKQEEIDQYFTRLNAVRTEGEQSYHRAVGSGQ
jgi:hypothetical protein